MMVPEGWKNVSLLEKHSTLARNISAQFKNFQTIRAVSLKIWIAGGL
jgi:hypothetical protein